MGINLFPFVAYQDLVDFKIVCKIAAWSVSPGIPAVKLVLFRHITMIINWRLPRFPSERFPVQIWTGNGLIGILVV